MNLETLRSKLNMHRLLMRSITNKTIKEKDINVFKSYNGELYEINDIKLIKLPDGKYQIIIG